MENELILDKRKKKKKEKKGKKEGGKKRRKITVTFSIKFKRRGK